ncbi:hypothetical protein DICVIV_07568 [Dictyocaulus viviparus]|uniref:Uncharacterized protein n=1 Tax=Dictyocaulus viviparus TaxID=29172 RepID=A0A0D8XP00_DICVI|nr:hypothetical protein DICVIV_07568 [Dictyocaulus viviparus]
MPELSEPGSAIMRIEWYGKNEALNHTRTQWHSGWAEKALMALYQTVETSSNICSPYAYKLADHFSLGESPRFQLVLSTVKQLKVLDYLNGLPSSTSNVDYFVLTFVSLFIVLKSITIEGKCEKSTVTAKRCGAASNWFQPNRVELDETKANNRQLLLYGTQYYLYQCRPNVGYGCYLVQTPLFIVFLNIDLSNY